MYNEAFNSGSSYLAPDGVEICGTHSWNTSGAATFSNASVAVLGAEAIQDLEVTFELTKEETNQDVFA